MNNDKNFIRQQCKFLRASLDTDFCSRKICEQIKNWNIYQKARHIMLFYPIGSEYSLLSLMEDTSKSFYFPCIDGDDMNCISYNPQKGFKTGHFNIQEPVGEKLENTSFLDLIFVPALAVDKQGFRLGYGKGYYDRFLKCCSGCLTVVPVSSKLIFDSLPIESHDVKVDCLITESEIIRITY